jgi:endogenous inhibitor of DNA gyrase (YacG/DUF329 family)
MSENIFNPHTNTTSRKIHCPSCKAEIIWSTDNPWRPFCSESCKNKDFIGWAKEEHRIPTDDGDENYDM